jgi:GTP-binding protein HflX
MSQNAVGNIGGLAPSQLKKVERLFERRIAAHELVPYSVAKELVDTAAGMGRMIGLLVSREGKVEEVVVGTRTILYLPDLGRYRLGEARLRRLRLVVSIISKGEQQFLTQDLITDLEKLRLDAVVGIRWSQGRLSAELAHLSTTDGVSVERQMISHLDSCELDFIKLMDEIESQVARAQAPRKGSKPLALLVHVSSQRKSEVERSIQELTELAASAGVEVSDTMIQRRAPDPKSVLGKGKLEEAVLHCLRLGIDLIIFDCELRPTQWRMITNLTELRVLDRSMVILDVFAQRAQSNEGRLQVELAQLKYNLPRLVEKDAGLSRLTGGIGGRGPGETKLEIERRRSRDRITTLEKRIEQLSVQRRVREARRVRAQIPLVVLVGYTNAGKSTLFNRLSGASVFVEDAMFATLDPTKRRVFLPPDFHSKEIVLSDTVGFIRDLPKELMNAFRATLEDLYNATLLLHVVDCEESGWEYRIASVQSILTEMELPEEVVSKLVFNKSDAASPEQRDEILARYPDSICVSAHSGEGVPEILEYLRENIKVQQDASSGLAVDPSTVQS